MKKLRILCILAAISLLSACAESGGGSVLGNIAYKKKNQSPEEYTVYIQEDGIYQPYLVLTDNYNGNVLLLRERLLPGEFIMRDISSSGFKASYYPNTDIDFFLKNEFLDIFTPSVLDMIVESEIIVTNEEGLNDWHGNDVTETITRKVFLLSASELGIRSGMRHNEGKSLKYFRDIGGAGAVDDNGGVGVLWLRTPCLWSDIEMWVVNSNGLRGPCPVSKPQKIRPAFCLPIDAPITQEYIDGKLVYVLEAESDV